ncbi:MAG: nicotinate-nicotinamide nucleotide adenylyltransferase [Alistipes sp.]
MAKAEQELAAPQFDRVVVNDCGYRCRRGGADHRSVHRITGLHAGGNDTLFGSFNPVHRGHVAVADAVLESTGAEALWFVVSPQNPFKAGKELAPETDRIEMARIALQSAVHSDRMAVSDIEFRLPKPNRTIRTLEKLRTEYPGRKFSLLIGSDNAGFRNGCIPKRFSTDTGCWSIRVRVIRHRNPPGRTALRS